jgi:DNA (cytosine-5)-methyltransferase 1
LGYDAGWCCYRAADVGAIHARERIGIIAHDKVFRCMDAKLEIFGMERNKQAQHDNSTSIIANYDSKRLERMREKQTYRFQEQSLQQSIREAEEWTRRSNLFEPKLLRNHHGVPNYVDRIKCLGNAVVPQQFYPIFKAIADIENSKEDPYETT